MRLCADTRGNPHGASVEVKCIDGSANPYLAAAALLGLALDGIAAVAPAAARGAGRPRRAARGAARPRSRWPTTQGAALDALERLDAGPRAPRAGDRRGTLAVRRYEQRTYGDAEPETSRSVCRLAFSC